MSAATDDPATPEWIRTLFDDLNTRHFGGKLSRPTIVIQRGAMEEKNACYLHLPQIIAKFGPLIAISLTEEVLSKGADYTTDTLLHEMVHHALATLLRIPYERHGIEFCAVANVIGATLGLGAVLPDTREAERWPQSLRD